ncbi:legumain-like [Physella acuta]|uniref:legumain-like n=1 Tax=Physella acuta TaxID=109671 RepID=UPI0027DB8D96|nr:legumain-like [Physella acuta]
MLKLGLATLLDLCFLVATVSAGKHWAFLVAGSNEYYNYRHQADVCHAYHVLRNHGFPEENIIVMMYDDIAYSESNPVKGELINRPGGPNVYPGVPKHYTGQDVRPDVFLKVLSGDAEGVKKLLGRDGKVIESGPDDKIFVNFVDHGGPFVVCFPDSYLHAEDLHSTIKSMHANKHYKQMVIYMEACHSGSMFDKLLESNINVFATTAANPNEDSYVCYYDDERQTFLGDVYSVSWMEDSDRENLTQETLQRQYLIVKNETNTSHVMEYGDQKISNLKVADFQGNLTSKTLTFSGSPYQRTLDAVPVSDVKLEILRRKMLTNSDNTEDQIAYEKLLKLKQETEDYFKKIVEHVTHLPLYEIYLNAPLHLTDFKCYRESLMLIRDMCPGLGYHKNDYISKQLKVIANMCEADIPAQKIWAAIGRASYDSNICIQST